MPAENQNTRPKRALVTGAAGGLGREVAGKFSLRGDAPFLDARAGRDPLVARLHQSFQVRIAHHPGGDVAAGPDDADGPLREMGARARIWSHDDAERLE